jgi:hypothetical protein
MFDNMVITGSESDLVTAIQNGTAVAVCDGSYMPKADKKRGSACLIIECQLTQARLVLICQSPGTYANAYRSEMTGLYAGMCVIHAFCLAHQIKTGTMSISCDNDGALWKTAMEVPRVTYKQKSSDLLRGIHYLKSMIPIKWTFTEVSGHQDDLHDYEDLDRISQLNVQCDTAAKKLLRECIHNNALQPYRLPFQGWRCQIDNVWRSDEVGTAVRDTIGKKKIMNHLIKTGRMSAEQFNLIYWDPIGTTMAASPQLYQLWASKQVTRFCGTGRMMMAMKLWDNDRCPCCKTVEETTYHILTCPDTDMADCFTSGTNDLKEWLQDHDTHPVLQDFLLQYIRQQDRSTFSQLPELPTELTTLAKDQDTIGWQNCLEGKLPYSLYLFQELYLDTLDTKRTITGWAAGLVDHILHITHMSWKHRCDVVHARELDGLKTTESNTLQDEIRTQFLLGHHNLQQEDHHLLQTGLEAILSLYGPEKKAWLDTIRVARAIHRT